MNDTYKPWEVVETYLTETDTATLSDAEVVGAFPTYRDAELYMHAVSTYGTRLAIRYVGVN